jgi:hypothetical protein
VDLSAVDLFASVGRPVVSGLKAGANIQPEPPSFVFSGTPVLLFGEVGETEGNQIELTWQGGGLRLPVKLSENGIGETVKLLQGSRLITDWESRYPSGQARAALEKRKQSRVAARLRELSQTYGLASREMSLVAVVTRPGDRPGELPETRVVTVGIPQDTAFGAYFQDLMVEAGASMAGMPAPYLQADLRKVLGRSDGAVSLPSSCMAAPPAACEPADLMAAIEDLLGAPLAGPDGMPATGVFETLFFGQKPAPKAPAKTAGPAETAENILLDLASRMDSDGGMPGEDRESRGGAAVIALLAFLSQGHTLTRGAFRSHVARLVSFLTSLAGLSSRQQQIVAAVIELVRKGEAPPGDWVTLAHIAGNHWKEVERGVRNAQGVTGAPS